MTLRHLSALLALFLWLAATPALAGVETNTSLGVTVKGSPLAAHGYDCVAYFTQLRAVKGSAVHSLDHKGATYQFVSAEHLKAFQASPDKYLPQYGGYCAFGAAEGAKFDGDPEAWTVEGGKLYLNLNHEVMALWRKDMAKFIDFGDHNWPKISAKAPADLKAGPPQKLK